MAFGLPVRASFDVTTSTPPNIDEISPRHTLNVRDVNGEGKEWTVSKACAKVVIYNSRNLTLRLFAFPLTSTIDLFGSSNITLVLDCPASSSPLGILQLDPKLDTVHIQYAHPSLVGSIILAPNRTQTAKGEWSFGFQRLTLQVGAEGERFELVDAQGRIYEPGPGGVVIEPESEEGASLPAQWVVKLAKEGGGWEAEPLKRSSGVEYPLL